MTKMADITGLWQILSQHNSITKDIREHTAYRQAAQKKAVEIINNTYRELLELEKTGGMVASEKDLTSL